MTWQSRYDAWATQGPPEPDETCLWCGQQPDDCECDECPTCGATGCIEHKTLGELWDRVERWGPIVANAQTEIRRRVHQACDEYHRTGRVCDAHELSGEMAARLDIPCQNYGGDD